LQATATVILLTTFSFLRPIISAFRIVKETVEVSSNFPHTFQLWAFAGRGILRNYFDATVASNFMQICVHSFVSYELSKDFRNYIRSNLHSLEPKSVWLCLDAYNKVNDILNQINSLDSLGFGLLVLYGIVDFSKYFHDLITSTQPTSGYANVLNGMECFVFWLAMVHAAEANSNVCKGWMQ